MIATANVARRHPTGRGASPSLGQERHGTSTLSQPLRRLLWQGTVGPGGKVSTMLDFTLTFGRAGNAGPFTAEGWSPAEPDFTWTQGNRATLQFPKPPPADYRLLLDLHAYLPADRPWQRIGVTLGDSLIGYRCQVVRRKGYDFY